MKNALFLSYFDYLGGWGLGLARFIEAPDAEKAKEILGRTDEPLFTGVNDRGVSTWAFYRKP